MRNRFLRLLTVYLILVPGAYADGGVLIPRDKAQPDPAILSLEEMEITIRIENGDARVWPRFLDHPR